MRDELTSLDLYFLMQEFQEIVNAKIDKVFQKDNLLQFQIHIPNKGKKFLIIHLPSLICICDNKEPITSSDKFALSLRKHIKNTRIREIRQLEFERILYIKLEIENKSLLLYIELFKPGNIVLCNSSNKIIMALKYKGFGSRLIRPGITYDYPKKEFNFLKLKESDLKKVLDKSDKKSVVITLATDLGLGGFYSEFLCILADIDKKSQKLNDKEQKRLFKVIKDIIKTVPKAYIHQNIITPIEIYKESEQHASFNKLLCKFHEKEMTLQKKGLTKKDKEKKKIERIIKTQETQITGLKKSYLENKKKGELIYEKYTEIKEIIEQVKKTLQKGSWAEVKKNKQIIDVNEKEKKVTITLK